MTAVTYHHADARGRGSGEPGRAAEDRRSTNVADYPVPASRRSTTNVNECCDDRCDAPPPRRPACGSPREHGHDPEGKHPVDHVQQLSWATASGNDAEAAGSSDPDHEQQEGLEARGCSAGWHSTYSAYQRLGADEQDQQTARDGKPGMERCSHGSCRGPVFVCLSESAPVSPLRSAHSGRRPRSARPRRCPWPGTPSRACAGRRRRRRCPARGVPRSTNGITSRATSSSAMPIMAPQMSGSIPRFAAMMFMPRVQLIG